MLKRASQVFTEGERERIDAAVAAAEAKTSGEIVPVLATESDGYDRAEDLAGLVFALAMLGVVWGLAPGLRSASEWDPAALAPAVEYWHVLLIVLPLFIVGAWLAARFPLLRRIFLREERMRRCVEDAADRVFRQRRVASTREATGIHIYVSLFERTVRVTGDAAIAAKLDDAAWAEVRDLILAGFRDGRPCDGFCAAIGRCGEILAAHFPAREDDRNELPDRLVLLD